MRNVEMDIITHILTTSKPTLNFVSNMNVDTKCEDDYLSGKVECETVFIAKPKADMTIHRTKIDTALKYIQLCGLWMCVSNSSGHFQTCLETFEPDSVAEISTAATLEVVKSRLAIVRQHCAEIKDLMFPRMDFELANLEDPEVSIEINGEVINMTDLLSSASTSSAV